MAFYVTWMTDVEHKTRKDVAARSEVIDVQSLRLETDRRTEGQTNGHSYTEDTDHEFD